MSRIWTSDSNARVFDWQEILEEWHDDLIMPSYVETLIENLKAASNPDSEVHPPLSQFLTYLNNEQAGLVWLLYELVTHRWMWSTIRLDYVRELVDEIENLDGCFPRFPGSPWTGKTVRQWLIENLTADELEVVQMMPALEAPEAYQTPQRVPRNYVAPPAPQRLSRSYTDKPRYPAMIFLLQREGEGEQGDDKININKEGDSYILRYTDAQSNMKFMVTDLSRTKVIEKMRMMLRMITLDEKPFDYLQVSLPGMPTILLNPADLSSQTRDLIYDSMESIMDEWPILV